MTACGVATTLLTINQVFSRGRQPGGYYQITPEMELDLDAAKTVVSGNEFIFDVQTHHVRTGGEWLKRNKTFAEFVDLLPKDRCQEPDRVNCLARDHYIREIFMDSDTSIAVLSAVPPAPVDTPLSTEESAATRAILDSVDSTHRLYIHGLVLPNIAPLRGQLDGMQKMLEDHRITAWKVYTPWGPDGIGWMLDDKETGIPFIKKAHSLGVKLICAHKGLPILGFNSKYAGCRDIGVVAKMFPDMTFIVYHSGFDPAVAEGPYDPNDTNVTGINTLIKSLLDHKIGQHGNVYADLGSVWRQTMRKPAVAAHVIGKLLKYVGEDRIVWGTDSIWYGSPQDQIQAFRAFQISEEYQEKYGYPALTDKIKAKVFGLNACTPYAITAPTVRQRISGDRIERLKTAYLENPQPSLTSYGPQTRREFIDLVRQNRGWPV
jgi:uncharacterized protein